jgi:glycosyltransferase domain-containing protein
MKDKIDLIIPTFNRPEFLERILDYYSPNAEDFNYLVADSSSKKNKQINKEIIRKHPELKIRYLDYPPTLSQHEKFAEISSEINTNYCVFCPDDDFIIPKGIKLCLKFLKKNPDYVAAHGTYISFYTSKDLVCNKKFNWRFLYNNKTISQEDPIERVAYHLRHYTLVLWAVSKTKVIQTIYKEFLKAKIDPYLLPVYGEILPDTLTVAYGKIKRINTFYSARQHLSQILGFYPSLEDAKKRGIYEKEYSKLKHVLMDNIRKIKPNMSEKDSEIIDSAFAHYEKSSYQQHIMSKINILLSHLPYIFKKSFDTVHSKYLFSKENTSKIGPVDDPKSKYYEDFSRVRECVLSH